MQGTVNKGGLGVNPLNFPPVITVQSLKYLLFYPLLRAFSAAVSTAFKTK